MMPRSLSSDRCDWQVGESVGGQGSHFDGIGGRGRVGGGPGQGGKVAAGIIR